MTVWSYMTVDDYGKPYHRKIFFRAASIDYTGRWLGPSDSVWIIPGTLLSE